MNAAEVPSDRNESPPAGFVEYVPTGEFMRLLGPIHARHEADGTVTAGLYVRSSHLNTHAVAHGGLLATVVDSILGFNAARAAGAPIMTANLNIGYMGQVRQGDWLEVSVEVERTGKRLVFLSCRGRVGGKTVVKADGVFAVRRDGGMAPG